MGQKQIDTSYNNFGFLLEELRSTLQGLHDHVANLDDDVLKNHKIVNKTIFTVVDTLACVVRDIEEGYVDYTNKPSMVIDVQDKKLLLDAFRKSYVGVLNKVDDLYLHHLHKPVWVCRHRLQNGKECWALSNICNEVSMLLHIVNNSYSVLEMTSQTIQN